ncbi:SGNH/GDSL hydrolase family protein [Nostocoides australiense]|nr:SGNH/GDSL hydrolase family protein [Actinomycetota bacterium]MCB1300032.1 SGNH/GDSL hydrolase family protein [Tetrasphaera sp.]HPF80539.1 SGNH/GDSL hydrolase family protein [Tetrasphaera australiensis]HRW03021.1 SGNH/GDSL hydrolase family protein [Tetrasphaera sp.]
MPTTRFVSSRATRTTTIAGLGAGLLVAATALSAHAAGSSYVALGDSYSSGTGTRTYIDDGTSCLRSVYAYPSLIASAKGYALNFRACSGATIADVTNTQLSALSASTAYVTMSVGGNDAGFARILTTCAQPSWMSDCYGAIDKATAFVNNTLPGSLSTLYTSIRAKAPNAKVTIVGYPRIFNGEDCNAFTWFSPTEEARLNAAADLLNSKLAAAASAKGFAFANPTSRFIGHAVCDSAEWINGLSYPIVNSYHPKVDGHAYGYTPAVSPYVTGSTLRVTSAIKATAAASADRLARQQRAYAAADSRITPKSFVAPDLSTPAAKAAAARAGVDLSSRASIDAADRRYDAAQRAARG